MSSAYCCHELCVLLSGALCIAVRSSAYCCHELCVLLSGGLRIVVMSSAHCCHEICVLLSGAVVLRSKARLKFYFVGIKKIFLKCSVNKNTLLKRYKNVFYSAIKTFPENGQITFSVPL